MNADFITDIEQLRLAQKMCSDLSESAKPYITYRDHMIDYVIAKHFRDYAVGMHPVSLPDGTLVEFDKGENVAVKEELLPVVFDQMIGATERADGVPYTDEQVAALNQLHKLVRWKPALDKRQYDKLPPDKRELFDQALQRSLAKPKINIKVPE